MHGMSNVIENNRLIAEFMGAVDSIFCSCTKDEINLSYDLFPLSKKRDDGSTWKLKDLQYHISWEWLMPCIGKISTQCEEPEELDGLKYALLCNDIDTAYKFVVSYLTDFNIKN